MRDSLNFVEFGKQIGRSHTWVGQKVRQGIILAIEHELTGEKRIPASEVDRYFSGFKPYVPPQNLQDSQLSQ